MLHNIVEVVQYRVVESQQTFLHAYLCQSEAKYLFQNNDAVQGPSHLSQPITVNVSDDVY